MGFPGGANGKEPAYQSGDTRDMGQSLGQDDFLEEGMVINSNILAWRIPIRQRSLVGYSPWGHKESDMTVTKQA